MSAGRELSIRTLLLLGTLAIFVGVTGISYFQAEHMRRSLREVIVNDLRHDVQLIREEQRRIIERAREVLLYAMASVPPDTPPEQCARWLERQVSQLQGIPDLAVASPDGRVRCRGLAAAPQANLADRRYF